jgi:GLPGLI family protein
MKRLIYLLLTLVLPAASLLAQPTADLKVSYAETFTNAKGFTVKKSYILLANASEAKYFNPLSERIDSLCSTPKGQAEYQQQLAAALEACDFGLSKPSTRYIFQSVARRTTTLYDVQGDKYHYEEPWEQQDWQIEDSTKTVLGYPCLKAVADYHGRRWEVWFTTEIPLSVGPWKLHGLPGLILEARDATSTYLFVADGVEQAHPSIQPMYRKEDYPKSDRKAVLKDARLALEYPVAYLKVRNGGSIEDLDLLEFSHIEVPEEWDFIEADYH